MIDEDENLMERISQLPDEELLQMVYVDYDQYRPEAIEQARAEIAKRGLQYTPPEKVDAQEEPPADEGLPSGEEAAFNPMLCPHCLTDLHYVGTRRFQESWKWETLDDPVGLFKNNRPFDVYVCLKCGRMDFFVQGVGEEYRTRSK